MSSPLVDVLVLNELNNLLNMIFSLPKRELRSSTSSAKLKRSISFITTMSNGVVVVPLFPYSREHGDCCGSAAVGER